MLVYTHSSNPFLISPISPLRKTVASPVGISFTAFDASPRFLQSPAEKSSYVLRSNESSNGQFWWTDYQNAIFSASNRWDFVSLKLNIKWREHFWRQNSHRGVILSALNGWNSGIESAGTKITRKRKIVEHLFLLRAKEDLSDDEEKDMLDYLYTSQYQMRGIIAISLGRIMDLNVEGFTHAVYMRFQRKEDLSKFYENVYSGLLREHVMPYCHGWINIDYKSEVEDDILPIFRKGEEFNYGVEFMLLISVSGSALGGPAEDALATFIDLTEEFGSLIVQATQGSNFNPCDREYTHAVVIRFPSFEALELFRNSSQYKDMWSLKFQPITQKSLAIHFAVDPVGTEIM